MQVERELKFRLTERAAARIWQLLPARPRRRRELDSVYYDTPLMELRGMHAALRLRRDGRTWLQTLKLDAGPNPGLSSRYEWEVPAPAGSLEVAAFPMREVEAAAQTDLRPTLLRARPVFSTRFERRSSRFSLPDGTRIEACVDRGWIIAGRRRAALLELELELVQGQVASLLSFAEELIAPLGMVLELQSKAERGYRLAAHEAAAPLKARRPSFECGGAAADALAAASLTALAQIAANLDGVAAGRDPEYLHQARVGMRRLRASLRAWRKLAQGKSAKSLEKALRGFSASFGPARDWDVFCEMLESRFAAKANGKARFAALVRRARVRRQAARHEAAAAAVSAPCQLFLLQAMRWVHEAPWRAAPRPPSASRFARERLFRLEKRAAKAGSDLDWRDAPARHQLRIRLKRLRYMAEFFARCFPARATERYIDRLKGLQDLLGELNDIAVADGLLEQIGKGPYGAAAETARRLSAKRERAVVRGLRPAWRRFRKTPRFWAR